MHPILFRIGDFPIGTYGVILAIAALASIWLARVLARERGIDPERIGLVGTSRGAVLATLAGAADERIGAVALMHGGHFDFLEDGHRPAACPANYIGRIAPRPLLSLSSETDRDFFLETSILPMHRLAGEPHTVLWAEGGHGSSTQQELSSIAEWLREQLR